MAEAEAIEIVYLDASELEEFEGNPRIHPAAQQKAMKQSLDDFGMVAPTVVNTHGGKKRLLNGHMRTELLAKRGEKVPCVLVDWDDTKEKRFVASFDRIGGMAEVSNEALAALVSEIEKEDANTLIPSYDDDDELEKLRALVDDSPDKDADAVQEIDLKAPTMAWVLIGIPTKDYHEIQATVESMTAIDGVVCEVSLNDNADS